MNDYSKNNILNFIYNVKKKRKKYNILNIHIKLSKSDQILEKKEKKFTQMIGLFN